MDHPAIDDDSTAERYVTGRLSPEEAARFEEHYLDCPDCQTRVEAAERLQRGLKRLAEEAAVRVPGPRRAPWRSLAAAALLAVALLPAWFELRETRRLRSDLGATREALVRTQTEKGAADRRAAAESEERQALARQMAADRQSWANLPVVALTPARGNAGGIGGIGGGGPVRTLKLPASPGWVALWVEPGDADFPAYRATLRTAQGAVVFAGSRLALNDLGALLIAVHSTTLAKGAYRLDVDGLPPAGAPVSVGRFSLRID